MCFLQNRSTLKGIISLSLILLLFTLLFIPACSAGTQELYLVTDIDRTEPEIYLQPLTEVTILNPAISSDLSEKFVIGEYSTHEFTQLIYKEFWMQLKSRSVTTMQGDYRSLNTVSIIITDYLEEGVNQFQLDAIKRNYKPDQMNTGPAGGLGGFPPCYGLEGIVSFQTPDGHVTLHLRKDTSSPYYARSNDLKENISLFTTRALDLLMNRRPMP